MDDLPEKPAKPDKSDKPAKSKTSSTSPGVSRRDFLKISGLAAAAVPAVASPKTVMAAGQQVSSGGFEEIVRSP